jgi:hypothetical protein
MGWWTENRWAINRLNRKIIKQIEDPNYVPKLDWVLTGDNAKRIGEALVNGETISDEEMAELLANEASKREIPKFKAQA